MPGSRAEKPRGMSEATAAWPPRHREEGHLEHKAACGFGEKGGLQRPERGRQSPPRDQVSHLRCLGDTVSGMRPDISNQVLRDAQEKMENESSLAV